MPDNDLMFYLAGCIFFLILSVSRRKQKSRDELVQLKNPRTKRYIKIDKSTGSILSHKKTRGPYKGIKIVG